MSFFDLIARLFQRSPWTPPCVPESDATGCIPVDWLGL